MKRFSLLSAILALTLVFGLALASCGGDDGNITTPGGPDSGNPGGSTSYTVSFSANGGSGTVPNPMQTLSSITLPSGSGLTRNGYTFGGWNTYASGSGINYPAGSFFTPTYSVNLYAKWDASQNLFVGSWTGYYTNGAYLNIVFNNSAFALGYGNYNNWQEIQGAYTYSGNSATLYETGRHTGTATVSGNKMILAINGWESVMLSK